MLNIPVIIFSSNRNKLTAENYNRKTDAENAKNEKPA